MVENKAYLKRPAWVAGIFAIFAGIVTHMFGLVNVLHNHDDLSWQPLGFGTGLSSGRWFLENFGRLFNSVLGGYNLPWVNGLLFIALLAVSAGLLVSILGLKSRKAAAFIGALFVVFPSVTSTMFYRYTVVYYGIAILLSVLAVYVLERYKRIGLLLSALCTAFSMGIYQAYAPITISIFVLLLIQRVLQRKEAAWKIVIRGIYYCTSVIVGLVIYYVLLQHYLDKANIVLGDYVGINEMGQLSIAEIPELIKKAIISFVKMPFDGYCGLAEITLIKHSYLLLGILSIGLIAYTLLFKVKRIDSIVISVVLCAVFPLAVNFIVIMTPEIAISTMTVHSFVIILCVPFVLMEALPHTDKVWLKRIKTVLSKVIIVVVAIVIASYAYLTNVNYTAQYYANRQAENYMSSLVTQVRMAEGFDTGKTWAFIGNINDPLIHNRWQIDPNTFRGNLSMKVLITAYSHKNWFSVHYGYAIPFASDAVITELSNSEEVKAMPCWPNEGSIKVIGDNVVIKCQELSN